MMTASLPDLHPLVQFGFFTTSNPKTYHRKACTTISSKAIYTYDVAVAVEFTPRIWVQSFQKSSIPGMKFSDSMKSQEDGWVFSCPTRGICSDRADLNDHDNDEIDSTDCTIKSCAGSEKDFESLNVGCKSSEKIIEQDDSFYCSATLETDFFGCTRAAEIKSPESMGNDANKLPVGSPVREGGTSVNHKVSHASKDCNSSSNFPNSYYDASEEDCMIIAVVPAPRSSVSRPEMSVVSHANDRNAFGRKFVKKGIHRRNHYCGQMLKTSGFDILQKKSDSRNQILHEITAGTKIELNESFESESNLESPDIRVSFLAKEDLDLVHHKVKPVWKNFSGSSSGTREGLQTYKVNSSPPLQKKNDVISRSKKKRLRRKRKTLLEKLKSYNGTDAVSTEFQECRTEAVTLTTRDSRSETQLPEPSRQYSEDVILYNQDVGPNLVDLSNVRFGDLKDDRQAEDLLCSHKKFENGKSIPKSFGKKVIPVKKPLMLKSGTFQALTCDTKRVKRQKDVYIDVFNDVDLRFKK